MSIEYTTWALKKVRGIEPPVRILLFALSDAADETGVCWPSMKRLSNETELSIPTIKRYRRLLRIVGAITEEKRVDPSGRQSSNRVQLNIGWTGSNWLGLSVKISDAEKALEQADADTDCEASDDVDAAQGGVHGAPLPPSSQGGHGEPQGGHYVNGGGVHTVTPLYEPPLEPPVNEEEEARARAFGGSGVLEDFNRLVKLFNPGQTESLELGRRKLAALTPEDRDAAMRYAEAFLKAVAAEGRKKPSIAGYLNERRWESVARLAGMGKQERSGGYVFVRVGTPAFEAWNLFMARQGKKPLVIFSETERVSGTWRESLFPPGLTQDAATDDGVAA
jgi:hypothetical protein